MTRQSIRIGTFSAIILSIASCSSCSSLLFLPLFLLRSRQVYLHDHEMGFLRESLRRLIGSEVRLQYILIGRRRRDQNLVAEATAIIQRHFRSQNTENITRSAVVEVEEITDGEQEVTRTIFDFRGIKEVAENLDFDTLPRKTRDSTSLVWLIVAFYCPHLIYCCILLQGRRR